MKTEPNKEKFHVQSGACAVRWICHNYRSRVCDPTAKDGKDYVECSHFMDEPI